MCHPTSGNARGTATTPTKGGIVGGVDEAMQAGCCWRYFWTGPLLPGAATTPTKGGIVGGVDEAMHAGCSERPFWMGLPFQGAATPPTNAKIVGGVDGAWAIWRNSGRCGPSKERGNGSGSGVKGHNQFFQGPNDNMMEGHPYGGSPFRPLQRMALGQPSNFLILIVQLRCTLKGCSCVRHG